jgi:CoA:oxalate CoA-transferase
LLREPPSGGRAQRLPSQPVKFSAYAGNRVTRAPALGEHTSAILRGQLGMNANQIEALQRLGAFGNTAQKESDHA